MKKDVVLKFCVHCGKPRATIAVQLKKNGATLYMHASCRKLLDVERIALATNGRDWIGEVVARRTKP